MRISHLYKSIYVCVCIETQSDVNQNVHCEYLLVGEHWVIFAFFFIVFFIDWIFFRSICYIYDNKQLMRPFPLFRNLIT